MSAATVEQLTAIFHRNGYVRLPNLKRRAATPRAYKKGYEVRLVAGTMAELRTIRRLLREAGFKPNRPFAKAQQWAQPLYGREAVSRFLALVEAEKSARGG
jgi:hypothetical protein